MESLPCPPSFTNPITCPLRASSITCQLYYVPITCQSHVTELARNRVCLYYVPITWSNRLRSRNRHVRGLLRACYVAHVTRYVNLSRNRLCYVHVLELVHRKVLRLSRYSRLRQEHAQAQRGSSAPRRVGVGFSQRPSALAVVTFLLKFSSSARWRRRRPGAPALEPP